MTFDSFYPASFVCARRWTSCVAKFSVGPARLAALFGFLALAGCNHQLPTEATTAQQETASVEQATDILDYVTGLLNGLGNYDSVESNPFDIIDLNAAARRAVETGVPPSLVSQL